MAKKVIGCRLIKETYCRQFLMFCCIQSIVKELNNCCGSRVMGKGSMVIMVKEIIPHKVFKYLEVGSIFNNYSNLDKVRNRPVVFNCILSFLFVKWLDQLRFPAG